MLASVRLCVRSKGWRGNWHESWRGVAGAAVTVPLPPAPIAPTPVLPADLPIEKLFDGLTEPTFTSLGIGGWSPVGIVQSCFEYLHVTHHIPWWGTIVIGTVCVRALLFPVVVLGQRNNANFQKHLPTVSFFQKKISDAKDEGNVMESSRYAQEMMIFMKKHNLSPLKSALIPFLQFPFFISFFMALRRMAALPVASMATGGILWFVDLTVPDQFYLLPVLTSATMYLTIEMGIDSSRMATQQSPIMKYGFRAIPFVMLPFTVNFPSAILCYWTASNIISLGQVGCLKIPAIKNYLKIPIVVPQPREEKKVKKKGIVKGAQSMWASIKKANLLENRAKTDEMSFNKAGSGPLVKTYSYNPTNRIAVQSRKL